MSDAGDTTRVDWSSDRVLRESARWRSSWHPPGSRYVVVDGFEFYEQDGAATLLNYLGPAADPLAVIRRALVIAEGRGAHTALVTIGPGPLAGVDALDLVALHAETEAVIDVVATEISWPFATRISVPPEVRAHKAIDEAGIAEFDRISRLAWGFAPPVLQDPESAKDDDEAPGLFVATSSGAPAGAGGYSLVGEVARMWGAAVLPEFRGRGVYRGLITARLRDAAERGATLALVHAEQTSSPILQDLGFAKVGERRRVRIATGQAGR
ncbi:GNAT family N-acetyltransferase [Gordonia sp. OPL2]|uniref:GNAT family N-acetyltransferase n=1 Tax=Gordonia sp. OPL2 TaxID=2486274 RepID=UPI0016561188|nr:GNAT family N-acetyltransferase [Gordonia sp. OPL2]RPA19914.1 GNAT family N-acetyltransferase [Gordonia sp. OPL2]